MSKRKDTKAATDERIEAIRRYLYDQLSEEDPQRDFNADAEYMLGVIEALQAEITSQKQSYEDVIAAMDKEIGRLRGLCGDVSSSVELWASDSRSIAGADALRKCAVVLDRASKGESHE